MLALTFLQHGNGNFKLNFHRDLREIESFFEACLAAAAAVPIFEVGAPHHRGHRARRGALRFRLGGSPGAG